MKFKLLGIICASLFSTSLLADSQYFDRQSFKLGIERLDIELNDTFEVQGNNFVGAAYQYKFTPYFGVELKALVPVDNKESSTSFDTFRSWNGVDLNESAFGDIESNSYDNAFEHNVMGSASLVLDLPLHDNFSVYANLGYTIGSVDSVVYTFVDNAPATDVQAGLDSGLDICALTGDEARCGQAISSTEVEFDGSGFSYGAGIRFSFISNDNISIGYNSYMNTSDLEISGWSVNYQWNF